MKYKVVNELDHFEYHDAVIVSQKREHGCIAWTLHGLNATTSLSLCDFEEDMCIEEAHILFEQVAVKEISIYEYSHTSIVKGQTVNYTKLRKKPIETAEKVLRDTDNSRYTWISCKSNNIKLENGLYQVKFEIENDQEFFAITFRYKSATIEWDEYQGGA